MIIGYKPYRKMLDRDTCISGLIQCTTFLCSQPCHLQDLTMPMHWLEKHNTLACVI